MLIISKRFWVCDVVCDGVSDVVSGLVDVDVGEMIDFMLFLAFADRDTI